MLSAEIYLKRIWLLFVAMADDSVYGASSAEQYLQRIWSLLAQSNTGILYAPAIPTQTDINTTSHILELADVGVILASQHSSATTITIPLNSSVAIPVGTVIGVEQHGTGSLSISPAAGVVLNSLNGNTTLSGQWAAAALRKISTDEWLLVGALI